MEWMVLWMGAAAGLVAGAALEDLGVATGVLLGFCLGYLLTLVRGLRRQVADLQRQVTALRTLQPEEQTQPVKQQPLAQTVSTAGALAERGGEVPFSREPDPIQGPVSKPPSVVVPVPALHPHPIDRLVRWLGRYFTEGNLIVRVGVLILLFGVGFLVKYAAERTEVPVGLRLGAVLAGGLGLFALGWWLRAKRSGYALALQGGGLGIAYLTLFAALRLYELLSPAAALPLMVLLVVAAGVLSLVQNAQSLAVLGLAGGFIAPVLASSGQGDHITLFTYYLILNGGIAAIAWFRAWRVLNLLGFVFTFVVGAAWGVLRYEPAHYASTQPFLLAFFLLYVAIALLFAARSAAPSRDLVDGTLVFGTPLAAFGLQAALVHEFEFGLAASAVGLALFYAGLSLWLHWRADLERRRLTEAFVALAVGFATLVVPLAVDGRWTAATWSLEAVALIWIATHQRRQLPIVAALAIYAGAGVAFGLEFGAAASGSSLAFLNSNFLGGLLLAAMALAGAYLLDQHQSQPAWPSRWVLPLLIYGLGWAVGVGLWETSRAFAEADRWAVQLIYLSVLASLLALVQSRLAWQRLNPLPLGLLAALVISALIWREAAEHPFGGLGLLAWSLAIACYGAQLYYWDRRAWTPALPGYAYAVAGWVVVWVLVNECHWQVAEVSPPASDWPLLAWAWGPALAVWAAVAAPVWPWARHRWLFVGLFSYPLVALLALWLAVANIAASGRVEPLRFVPLLNPLDITSMGVLSLLLFWWRSWALAGQASLRDAALGCWGSLAFFWFNALLLRTLHHWADIPLRLQPMLQSTLAQATLSVAWTLLALAAAIYATRHRVRRVWVAGAALIAVVVVKLFVFDLAGTGTLARIVSFIGVGTLLLVLGYFAPIPPAKNAQAQ